MSRYASPSTSLIVTIRHGIRQLVEEDNGTVVVSCMSENGVTTGHAHISMRAGWRNPRNSIMPTIRLSSIQVRHGQRITPIAGKARL